MRKSRRKSESRTVYNGIIPITYTLSYAKRKTLGITVRPDLSVYVRAPIGTTKRLIDALVLKRASWIIKHQHALKNAPPRPPPWKYIAGETHYYLGKPYLLKVNEVSRNEVRLEQEWLYIGVRKNDSATVKKVLDEWYREQAITVFAQHLAVCYAEFAHIGIPYPELKVRMMKSSWGITRGEKITLNVRLVKKPSESIDLVIFHELCHLVEPNHSRRFYALLDRMLPDWRERKGRMGKFQ